MASNNNDALISLGVDYSKSLKNINKAIKELSKNADTVSISVDVDTSKSKKQINASLKELTNEISEKNSPSIAFSVNKSATTKKIKEQLKQVASNVSIELSNVTLSKTFTNNISKQLKKALNVDVSVNNTKSSDTKEEIASVQNLNKQVESLTAKINKLNAELAETRSGFKGLGNGLGSSDIDKKITTLESQLNKLALQASKLPNALRTASDLPFADDYQLALKQTTEQISDMSKKLMSIGQMSVAEEQANEFKALEKEISNVKATMQSLKTLNISDLGNLKDEEFGLLKQSFSKDIDNWLSNNTRASKSSKEEAKQITASMQKIKDSIESADKATLSKLRTEFTKTKKEARELGVNGSRSIDEFVANFKKFSSWLLVGNAFMTLSNNVMNAVEALKEVDTYLTEIAKTSDMTDKELTKLGNTAFDTASKLGATGQSYLSAMQEISRSGYTGDIAEGLANLVLLTETAGDVTQETAQKYILATDKAYGYAGSIEKLQSVLDGQNAITNNFSVSMEDMAEATEIAGSIASTYGVQIEDLSSMIGTMVSRTQKSGNEMGTALKSLLVNFQNLESSKIVNTFDSVGISMTEMVDGAEKLKNPIQLIKELSQAFNSLEEGDPLKASILTNIGGKHQANALSALLSGMEDYQKMLETYNNPQTTAMDEAQKTIDSWQGRINKLSNTWNSFVQDFVNSDLVKFAITGLESIIKLLDKLEDTIGAFPTILAGAFAFKNIKSGFQPVKDLISEFKTGAGLDGLFSNLDDTQLTNLTKELTGTVDATKGLENLKASGAIKEITQSMVEQASVIQDLSLKTQDFTALQLVQSLQMQGLSKAEAMEVLTKTGLTTATTTQALQTKVLTEEKVKEALATSEVITKQGIDTTTTIGLAKAKSTLATATNTLNVAQNSGVGIAGKLSKVFSGLGAVIKANPIMTAVTVVTTAIQIISKLSKRAEEARKALLDNASETKKAYEDALSSIESLNDELDTTKQRINELLAKPSLTLTEQSELSNLQNQNDELERQLRIEEELAKYKKQESSDSALEVLNSKSESFTNLETIGNDGASYRDTEKLAPVDALKKQVEQANQLREAIDKVRDSQRKYEEDYLKSGESLADIQKQEGWKHYSTTIEDYKEQIKQIEGEISTLYGEILTQESQLDPSDSSAKQMLDQIDEAFANMQQYLTQDDTLEGKMSKALDTEPLSKYSSLLEKMAKQGTLTSANMIASFREVIDYTGMSAEEAVDSIYAVFNATDKNAESILNQVLSLKDNVTGKLTVEDAVDVGSFEEWINSLSTEDLKIVYSLISKGELSFNNLYSKYTEQKNKIESNPIQIAFGDYNDDNGEFSITKFMSDETISDIEEKAERIQTALSQLGSGELDSSGVMDLMTAIPELSPYIDMADKSFGNLEQGLKTLGNETLNTLIKDLELMRDGSNNYDAESKKTINNVISYYKDLQNQMDKVKESQTETGFYNSSGNNADISNYTDKLSDARSEIESLNNLTKELDENHMSSEVIDTILSKYPQYVKYLNDEKGLRNAIKQSLEEQKQEAETTYKEMMELSNEYYNTVVTNMDDQVKELAKGYGIDLSNYKSLAEAKAEIDEKLLNSLKKAWADYYKKLSNAEALKQSLTEYDAPYAGDTITYKDKNGNEKQYTTGEGFKDYTSSTNNKVDDTVKKAENTYNEVKSAYDKIINALTGDINVDFDATGITTKTTDSTKKGSDTKNSFSQVIDWIERRLNKFADTAKDIIDSVYDYASADNRVKKFQDGIKKTGELLSEQQKAYSKYMSIANSVKFSKSESKYRDKVQNGEMSIENITDENLAKKIESYTTYYDKAQDMKDAIEESKDSLKEYSETLARVRWDKASEQIEAYSRKIETINAKITNTTSTSSSLSKLYEERLKYERKSLEAQQKAQKDTISDQEKVLNKIDSKYKKSSRYYSDGTLSAKGVTDTKQLAYIRQYNAYVTKLKETTDELALSQEEYKQTVKDTAQELADMYTNIRDDKISGREGYVNLYNTMSSNANSYTSKNSYIDKMVNQQKKIAQDYSNAVTDVREAMKDSWGDIAKKNRKDSNGNTVEFGVKVSTKGLTGKAYEDVVKYNTLVDKLKESTLEAKQADADYKAQLADSAQTKFNNVTEYYDVRQQIVSAKQNKVNNAISMSQRNSQVLGNAYYEELIRLEKDSASRYQSELTRLRTELNQAVESGQIEKYSPAWHSMLNQIYSVESALSESNLELAEMQNKLADLKFQSLDLLADKISEITTETNFLINALDNADKFNDNGSLTTDGVTVAGLHAQNYDTYSYQAEKYKEALEELDGMYSREEIDQAYYLEQRKELVSSYQSAVSGALSEKNAIISLIQEGIQQEIEYRTEAINKKKEELDAEKELYEYQKSIAKKTKNVTSIQKQLLALEGDDSLEARKKIQQLKKELADAQEDLDDTIYNKDVEMQKEQYDKDIEDLTKILTDYSNNTTQVFEDAMTTIQNSSASIANNIGKTASDIGYTIQTEIKQGWLSSSKAVETYSSNLDKQSVGIINTIDNIYKSYEKLVEIQNKASEGMVDAIKAENANNSSAVKNPTTTSTSSGSGTASTSTTNMVIKTFLESLPDLPKTMKAKDLSTLNQYVIKEYGGYLSKSNMVKLFNLMGVSKKSYDDISSSEKKSLLEKLKDAGFSTGGIAKAVRQNGDHGLATIQNMETVMPVKFTELLPEAIKTMETVNGDLIYDMSSYIKSLSNGYEANSGNTGNSYTFSIDSMFQADTIDMDLLQKIKSDDSVKNFIKEVVAGGLVDATNTKGSKIR